VGPVSPEAGAAGGAVVTRSPGETVSLGRRVGAACGPGAVLALVGDLGSGKTCFAKGVATGLGVSGEDAVTSPSFVLMHLYEGRCPVAHFDLYRLEAADLASLGFYDLRKRAAILIEWAEKVPEGLLGDHARIHFEIAGETTRRLRFRAAGPRSADLLRGLNLYP